MGGEALAVALAGYTTLGESANGSIRPVDRLHAVGAAQRMATYADRRNAQRTARIAELGVDLMRYTRGGIDGAQGDCVEGLAGLLGKGLAPDAAILVAIQAISEFHSPNCKVCKGRRDESGFTVVPNPEIEHKLDGPVPTVVCPSCRGTGARLWTDTERSKSMGCNAGRLRNRMAEAHYLISEAISLVSDMEPRLIGN
jgi:hypothetical protein